MVSPQLTNSGARSDNATITITEQRAQFSESCQIKDVEASGITGEHVDGVSNEHEFETPESSQQENGISASSSSTFVYPLKKPCFQTHRYDPKDLEAIMVEKLGQEENIKHRNTSISSMPMVTIPQDSSPSFSETLDRSFSLNTPDINPANNRSGIGNSYSTTSKSQTHTPQSSSPFVSCIYGSPSPTSRTYHSTLHSSSGQNDVTTRINSKSIPGSIYPRTPPYTFRASRMFISPPIPMQFHNPSDVVESGVAAVPAAGSQPHPVHCYYSDHQESITLSINCRIYRDWKKALKLWFLVGFLCFPCWIAAGVVARFKVKPLLEELEEDRFFFGKGPEIISRHASFLRPHINNHCSNADYSKCRNQLYKWILLCESFAILSIFIAVLLPLFLIVFLMVKQK